MAALRQITGTVWDAARPRLRLDDATLLDLAGPFEWDIGRRTCIGYWTEGRHPCPDKTPTGQDWQCLACFRGRGDPARRDDMPACIFEPVCQGAPERCVCSFGGIQRPEPHVVYCAFYGGLPKVGMTMERRVDTRLTEQGADAYFIVERTDDRQTARRTETTVAKLYGLPEWRRHDEVFPQLTRPVDRDRIEAAARQWRADLGTRFGVGELHHIEHPLPPLPGRPRRVPVDGRHSGTWLGGKGSHLFYEAEEGFLGRPVHALKRGELIGRWIDVR